MRSRNTRTSTINAKVPSFDEICEKAGFGDLKPDNRSGLNPIKRMAIWHYMHVMGVRLTDIARQSNRSHATVWSGIRKFNDYLEYGDRESLRLSDKINLAMSTNGYVIDKKYQRLFILMKEKHNVTLTNDEMREIIDVASTIK